MRFIKQRDKFNCAPIAVMNALKWIGYPVTLKDLAKYNKLMLCSDEGTDVRNITKVLKPFRIKMKVIHPLKIEVLEKHIARGGAFILSFRVPGKKYYHSAFFLRKHNGKWLAANFNPDIQKYALSLESNVLLNQILRTKAPYMPIAWLLTKLDK